RLGALVLTEAMLPPPSGPEADAAILDAVRAQGLAILPWSDGARALRERMRWLQRHAGDPWPDVSDEALLARLEEWLLPWLTGSPELAALAGGRLEAALLSLLPHDMQRELERLAPARFTAPTGTRVAIRYDREIPAVAIRVQELYGLREHP